MIRRTKIVATLGPATSSEERIDKLVYAGVNVVRLNFSHGDAADHKARADLVRKCALKYGRHVAILADLQGPKIRVSRFQEGKVNLVKGETFVLDTLLDKNLGTKTSVGIDYEGLAKDCSQGDILLLDDGRVELKVTEISEGKIICEVLVGGVLSNNKGINRKGGGLSAPALTEKDKSDIVTAASLDVDYLAVSFPRCAEDINTARELMSKAGGDARIVAKIERSETVTDSLILDEIILASDAVMVARGDLGVEIGDAQLIGVQKDIINRARANNRVVITATQMMESMIHSPLPTRAEVFDVANAVLDGTDAVMLSAETAAGEFPIETIEAMNRIILGAEKHPNSHRSDHRVNETFEKVDESIALGAIYLANHLKGVTAIICMTETGDTPLQMSRIRSHQPIFAFTPSIKTQNRVALFRGVKPVPFDSEEIENDQINIEAIRELIKRGVVADGDKVLITKGNHANVHGGTNTLKIVNVSDAIGVF